MKPSEKIEAAVRRMSFAAGTEIDRRLWAGIEHAMDMLQAQSIEADWHSKRFFMPYLIPQLAFAGAPLDAIAFGVTGSPDPEVSRRDSIPEVRLSRGVTLRSIETISSIPNYANYTIRYFAPKHSRADDYRDGQIVRSYYVDMEAMTRTLVVHQRKHYLAEQMTGEDSGFLGRNEDWLNPRYLLGLIQSVEHRELGSKTIDGVECEGIETTEVAVLGPLPSEVTHLDIEMRLWVDTKTKYPVRFENKMDGEAEGKRMSSEGVLDQFQWDVELDPSLFKPDLTGYEDIRNL